MPDVTMEKKMAQSVVLDPIVDPRARAALVRNARDCGKVPHQMARKEIANISSVGFFLFVGRWQ